jgi:hypothetical protein
VVVHDLNMDKTIVRDKSQFLSQHPFEVPCKGLFMALISYHSIIDGTIRTLNPTVFWQLTGYELVHLKSIKENFGGDDFEAEFNATLRSIRSESIKSVQSDTTMFRKPSFAGSF